MSHYLLYHKHTRKISYRTETGTVILAKGAYEDCMDDIIENIGFVFILGILLIDGFEYFAFVKSAELVGMYQSTDMYKVVEIDFLPMSTHVDEDVVFYLRHLVQTNDFYVCNDKFTEDEFIWNLHMQQEFFKCKINDKLNLVHRPKLQKQDFMIGHLFCGYFVSKSFRVQNNFYNIKLLSLVSSKKIGTRLLSRGIDKTGNVSFFVKTHVEARKNSKLFFSFTVLRGTIPLFWMQKNKGLNGKVYFTGNRRSLEAAFDLHFRALNDTYGKVRVVTLLGTKSDERLLNEAYIDLLARKSIEHFSFDLNAHTQDYENLTNVFFWHLDKKDDENTIYRVNCIDCLDRTNLAQYLICKYRLDKIIKCHTLNKVLQECWTENGNSLSNLYTGSDVMKKELSLKQKRSLFGIFDDLVISATRLINNRFTDKQKNKIIHLLLGKSIIENGI